MPDPPGVPALVGTFAHLVLEHLLQRPGSERTQDNARALARTLWSEFEQEPDYRALGLTDVDSKDFRWRAWIAIEGLWSLENPEATVVHATEQEIQVDIAGVPFRGIIDRLEIEDDEIVISDYKSGKAPSHRFRHSALKQVLLYAAAVAAETGRRPLGARLLYLGQKRLGIRATQHNIDRVTEDLTETWTSLLNDCDSNSFDTTTGPLCAWCPFLSACPDGQAEVLSRHELGKVRADAPGLTVVAAEAG